MRRALDLQVAGFGNETEIVDRLAGSVVIVRKAAPDEPRNRLTQVAAEQIRSDPFLGELSTGAPPVTRADQHEREGAARKEAEHRTVITHGGTPGPVDGQVLLGPSQEAVGWGRATTASPCRRCAHSGVMRTVEVAGD